VILKRVDGRTKPTNEHEEEGMIKVGYFLSSEEFGPNELIEQAKMAEAAGFEALWVSDHFHPWTSEQGNSPFVWSVIGGLSQATSLPVTTGVTCPTMRIHPAIIAQAAATSAVMLGGRFSLGVGSGENLNEHIFGDRWPPTDVRLEMLEEAIGVMRLLWEGGVKDHHGKHYTVENAQLYTLPEEPPPVLVSGSGRSPSNLRGASATGTAAWSPTLMWWGSSVPRAERTSRPTRARRCALWKTRLRRARPPTGCGPTSSCPGSWPRSCRRRSTSSRPRRW
jgi:alkanesulfonate monooxygenase SsuD/methylene tetrahydromethanopterin reductase-like flavin-dependent oxidoreductase (luciferase family)